VFGRSDDGGCSGRDMRHIVKNLKEKVHVENLGTDEDVKMELNKAG
jgi:hypothetical protein